MNSNLKESVKKHWEDETCGVRYGASSEREAWLNEIEHARYSLEPYIPAFANFAESKGKKVLEIGVGAGVDFLHWIRYGAEATGVDLTDAAINATHERLEAAKISRMSYVLQVADAENLPFQNNAFDIVYSWGVLHHTPDTVRAFTEAYRVLKPGGTLRAMIYHTPSWTGLLLWVRTCLLKGKIFTTPRRAIFEHLESPGTKVYTLKQADAFLTKIGFKHVKLSTKLCAGDLLAIKPSKKYRSVLDKIVFKLYPRWLVRAIGDRFGLELLITTQKPN